MHTYYLMLMKKLLPNLVCTAVLVLILSFIGIWLTRISYWDVGLIFCSLGVCLLIAVEIIKMIYTIKVTVRYLPYSSRWADRISLAYFILFMRSSLIAHFVCAYFFFKYIEEIGIITHLPWQEEFINEDIPNSLFMMLLFFLLRVVVHLWFLERLLKKESYYLV